MGELGDGMGELGDGMEEERFDLLIIYWDGREKVIKNVECYKYDEGSELFAYEKNGYRAFLPKDMIRFIGRKSDYYD